jgi:cytochrome c peroxidase
MTCVEAKRNATSVDGGPGEDPLFTDFTVSNIGTPANPQLPYYAEGEPDARGYVANKSGASFIDLGVGGFSPMGIRSVFRSRYAVATVGRAELRTLSGAHAAQRRQAAEP